MMPLKIGKKSKLSHNQKVIRSFKNDKNIEKGDRCIIRKSDKKTARSLLTMEEYYIWDFFMTMNPYNESDAYYDLVLNSGIFVDKNDEHIKGWGMPKAAYLKAINGLIAKGYLKQSKDDERLYLAYSFPLDQVKE